MCHSTVATSNLGCDCSSEVCSKGAGPGFARALFSFMLGASIDQTDGAGSECIHVRSSTNRPTAALMLVKAINNQSTEENTIDNRRHGVKAIFSR